MSILPRCTANRCEVRARSVPAFASSRLAVDMAGGGKQGGCMASLGSALQTRGDAVKEKSQETGPVAHQAKATRGA